MRIFEINSGNYGSTGNIMLNIAKTARDKGHEVKVAYRKSRSTGTDYGIEEISIGNSFFGLTHRVFAEVFGLEGCLSILPTIKLIKEIKAFSPDIVHLHILHGWYINLPILFRFLKKSGVSVVWTMHDCWAFTGHCPHFQIAKCEKWKETCKNCPQYRGYPYSKVDNSAFMFKLKKKYFSLLQNLTIVTPSEWLKNLIEQSFLKNYEVKVINNGINLSIFKPSSSDFRNQNNISSDDFLILGVAFDWDEKKGLDVFEKLSGDLPKGFKIALIGIDENIEKNLPENIIKIRKTKNQQELASVYSSADLFVNPTREDTYPTVNMEAIACGTPVLTFKTGGSPEIVNDNCGVVVECDDYLSLKDEIIKISEQNKFSCETCEAEAKRFDMYDKFNEYVELYSEIIKNPTI